MAITPTELRRDLYRLLDTVLETGVSLEIRRHGRTVRLVPDSAPSMWERVTRERIDGLVVDDESPELSTTWQWGEPELLDGAEMTDRGLGRA